MCAPAYKLLMYFATYENVTDMIAIDGGLLTRRACL